MKISVIIPVYNSAKYLDKLLNSIMTQTYGNYEVVIINDGSTDNSLEVINSISKNDNRINCITIKNSGPGLARKRGFDEATGDLLFFIDSDDYIPYNDTFEKIVKIYREQKFDILFFDFIRDTADGKKNENCFFNSSLKEGKYNIEFIEKHALAGALWCKIFIREKMKSEYFCNYNNYEDYYTTYKYLQNCENFYYTKEIFYYANRNNENSISKTINSTKISNTVELLKKIYNESKFKDSISLIMYNYYVVIRRKIDRISYDANINEDENKIKELKPYFNLKLLIKMKQNLKRCLIYVYYNIKDAL